MTRPEVSPAGWLEFARRCGGCIAIWSRSHLFWLPRGLPCPYVMTVHDVLEHLALAHGKSNLKRFWHFQFTRRALEGAARIVAVSEFTRQEVRHLFKIPQSKIDVAYNALDERFLHGHATDAEKLLIAERYQVNYPFPALCGTRQRAQECGTHHRSIFRAQGRACQGRQVRRLEAHHHWRRRFQPSRPAPHGATQRVVKDVRFLGFVPIDILRIFYDAAKVFCVPSLYEGFGLPPLEAMAHGTPVVTSNTSSLPKLWATQRFWSILKMCSKSCAGCIARARPRAPRPDEARSIEQVAKFSWESSVRQLLKTYRVAVGSVQPKHTHLVERAS